MFENLKPLQADPILGLMAEYRGDKNKNKIDLGVGVYKDNNGNTPIMMSVSSAEKCRLENEKTKAYIGPAGSEHFNQKIKNLIYGSSHQAIKDNRISSVQTPGGCGALRVGAELIKKASKKTTIWVSDPTWANHVPLLGNAGLKIKTYSYYNPKTKALDKANMLQDISKIPAGDVVLLHGCCHNPSGVDLEHSDWEAIVNLALKNQFVPFVDLAYLGLGDGIDEDAFGLRLLAERCPEVIVASSFSKNFGLYRERTGALQVLNSSSSEKAITQSQLGATVRGMYSMPPAHGAAIVETILSDSSLESSWRNELKEMRDRINTLRNLVSQRLSDQTNLDFSFIKNQKGMFSFLGIEKEKIKRLKEQFSIYIVDSSRINIAGLSSNNMDYFVNSIADVIKHD